MAEVTFVAAPRSRAPLMAYAGLFAVVAVVAQVLAWHTRLALFGPLMFLAAWPALWTVARLLPRWPLGLRAWMIGLGAAALVGYLAYGHWFKPVSAVGLPWSWLQLATIVVMVGAFVLYFAGHYGTHRQRQDPSADLGGVLPAVRLLAAAQALAGVALLLRLYTTKNFLPLTAGVLIAVALVLVLETLLRGLVTLYQPQRLRARSAPLGDSALLPALFGEAGPLRSLAATLETSLGIKLGDAWLVRLARAWCAPFMLMGLAGLIVSTMVTRVPVDARGVLVERGRFAEVALMPGLHLHAPWPWARVITVPTERVQEVALGFERDLAGPVLWAEKHFEGEQNLLVGEGEELLTVNAPVQYRIRDAVAYLRHTAEATAALSALGYRQLLTLTTRHTSFGLMTTERGEIAQRLREGLQADCDRLGLGLEIVFVGLKDVHPPVAVTPAYQDVVSADEERLTVYDRGVAESVNTLSDARGEASHRRLAADTFATERRFRAQGEAARFLAPLPLYREYRDVYRDRVRLETLETVLAPVRSLVLLPASQRAKAHLYFAPDGALGFPAR